MSVWVVRAGKRGELEQAALEGDMAVVGWRRVPDLTTVENRQALEELCRTIYPESPPARLKNHAAQLWTFRQRLQIDDLAILPLTSRSAVAIGRVAGPYTYRTDLGDTIRHTRPVEWLRTDIPRTAFDQDLLYSFGAMLTVYRIQRNDAEARIRAMLKGGTAAQPSREDDDSPDAEHPDLELAARDQLLGFIGEHFKGHAMAHLVDAILQAEGYLTRVSPPGPDGGVDILAGSGPMGFDPPRLCVQVKSGQTPVGVKVFRELRGVVQQFNADQGLLVSWGGFNSKVIAEAASSFFTVRLWDSGDLLAEILKNYVAFPDDLQAALPLKTIWVLVSEEQGA